LRQDLIFYEEDRGKDHPSKIARKKLTARSGFLDEKDGLLYREGGYRKRTN